MSGSRLGYIPSLDGVRALAVALVFFSHVGYGHIVPGGFGVTVFFFLSGYLITTLMLGEYARTGRFSIGRFYLRRALRILPAMYFVYFSIVFLSILGWYPEDVSFSAVVLQSLHLTNYASMWGVPILDGTGVLWSLAVEEHFYLVFPFIAIIFMARLRWFIVFIFIFCCASLLWRMFVFFNFENPSAWIGVASDTRMDSIAWGVGFALLVWGREGLGDSSRIYVWGGIFCVSVALICATFLVRDYFFRDVLRYSLQGIFLMPVFYCVIYFDKARALFFLRNAVVRHVGVLSYTIYLVHAPIIVFLEDRWGDTRGFWFVICALCLTYFVSEAIYRAIDVPVARFRRRWSI